VQRCHLQQNKMSSPLNITPLRIRRHQAPRVLCFENIFIMTRSRQKVLTHMGSCNHASYKPLHYVRESCRLKAPSAGEVGHSNCIMLLHVIFYTLKFVQSMKTVLLNANIPDAGPTPEPTDRLSPSSWPPASLHSPPTSNSVKTTSILANADAYH